MTNNRLALSTSAYLRQHADNPVQWYEWGDEAFAVARANDQPVFLSIGYAACHWCHVMAHESFEDDDTAQQLNDQFVCIKVDREERPDVDALYMAATQAMSGHGGWPMSVFLTPDGKPFMAGTYYPPTAQHGQPAFREVLTAMDQAWRTRRDTVIDQADQLTEAMDRDTRFVDHLAPTAPTRSWFNINKTLVADLVTKVDSDGGFGGAPKFPRPSYVEALLVRWHEDAARHAATLTLDAMSREGLYDHLGGGFARYSVDAHWHVPHFEKMLSDQALLASAYLRADRAADGDTAWRTVALDTLRFVVRDLAVLGGFASSLDADAGGVEGSHITWTTSELRSALEPAGLSALASRAERRWRITEHGEYEGRSIPRLAEDEPFATPEDLREVASTLLAVRRRRTPPGRDEKVVLEWNAMFASAAVESRDPDLVDVGLTLLGSLARTHFDGEQWWRTEARRAHATASDVGWLFDARLTAYEATGDDEWLDGLDDLVAYLVAQYWDGDVPTAHSPDVGGGVFTSAVAVSDLVQRPKEIFDGATPSAQAVVATALARYALLAANDDVAAIARRLIDLAGTLLDQHPAAVPDLVRAYGYVSDGREIVIPGRPNDLADLVRSTFVPSSVLITGSGRSPLLRDRVAGSAYLCQRRVCSSPVSSTASLGRQLAALRPDATS